MIKTLVREWDKSNKLKYFFMISQNEIETRVPGVMSDFVWTFLKIFPTLNLTILGKKEFWSDTFFILKVEIDFSNVVFGFL